MEAAKEAICRICLEDEKKVFHMNSFHLQQYYEEIVDVQDQNQDHLPLYFCYECSALLYKYHQFRMRCLRGLSVLYDLLVLEKQIRLTSIKKIDKEGLAFPLSACPQSKCTNVSQDGMAICELYCINANSSKISSPKHIQDSDSDDAVFSEQDSFKLETEKECKTEIKDEEFGQEFEIPLIQFSSKKSETSGRRDSVKENKRLKKFENNIKLDKSKRQVSKRKRQLKKLVTRATKVVDAADQEKIIKELSGKYMTQRGRATAVDSAKWEVVELSPEEQKAQFEARRESSNYRGAPHPCALCLRGFLDPESFAVHSAHHAPSAGQYECGVCKVRFSWLSKLNYHMKGHCVRYRCKRCPYTTVNKSNTVAHDKYHEGVTYKCIQCDLTFRKPTSYHTHMRIRHRSRHVCPACGDNFINSDGLAMHRRRMHAESEESSESAGVYCARCDIRFLSEEAFKKHLLTSDRHDADTSERRACGQRRNRTRAVASSGAAKPAGGPAAPLRHRAAPAVTGHTTCEKCGEWFRTERQYVKHFKASHPEEKLREPYICEVCGVTKPVWLNLQLHMQTHGEPKYECGQCEWKFKTVQNLYRHRIVHTGEKPYECGECGKRFTQTNGVKLHYRTVHLKQPHPKRDRRKRPPPPDPQPPHISEGPHNSEAPQDSEAPQQHSRFINAYLVHTY